MEIALELKAVSKRYGTTIALDGVDLDVAQGQTVAVLGPNGAGKTTMLSIALGLLSPGEGTARVFGRPPTEALQRGEVGALLQDAGLLDDVRVAELVTAVAGMYPHPMPVERVMRAAGVQDLEGRRVGRLSGGQQQRVRFALATRPRRRPARHRDAGPVGPGGRRTSARPKGDHRDHVRQARLPQQGAGGGRGREREAEVLRAASDGSTVADIAGRLFLTDGTVRNYLSSAIGKTGARNRAEAVRVAESRGWL